MTPTGITPLDAATAVLQNPTLPAGDDERFVGFGVLGLPFASGHYLALRYFPATSFAPPYRSVWHRDPDGGWTFYATTPGPQSCARYFSSVTRHDAVQCGIEVAWVTSWSLAVRIEELLEWEIDLSATLSTRALSTVGTRLPAGAWASRAVLGLIGRLARPALRAGRLRLAGTAPNGQRFTLAPRQRCGWFPGPRPAWRACTSARSDRCRASRGWPGSGPRSGGVRGRFGTFRELRRRSPSCRTAHCRYPLTGPGTICP